MAIRRPSEGYSTKGPNRKRDRQSGGKERRSPGGITIALCRVHPCSRYVGLGRPRGSTNCLARFTRCAVASPARRGQNAGFWVARTVKSPVLHPDNWTSGNDRDAGGVTQLSLVSRAG